MKTSTLPFLLLLCVGLLGWSSCGEDDIVVDSLNYDGDNFTAPFNDAGLHTFAAYFPPGETQAFSGRSLERVSFWMEQVPGATSVVIFAEGANDDAPGAELYRSLDLSQRIRNRGWQDHFLTSPLTIGANEGLWIAVEVDIPSNQFQAIGCDQGLNFNPNGDRYEIPQGPTWTNFEEFTGTERINWNIRGFLAEE
jgi:hypothetical protein